ncbi:hypothetical protein [Mesorhizobium sp. 10J20-29]
MNILNLNRTLAVATLLAAAPVNLALAQTATGTVVDGSFTLVAQQQSYLDVMANLEAAGYVIDSTKTTFLGRVQITAHNRQHQREIVVSRATGEIKSDVITELFEGSASATLGTSVSGAVATQPSPADGGLLSILGFGSNVSTGVGGSAGTTAGTNGGSVTGNVSTSVSGAVGGGLSGNSSGGSSGGASGGVSGGVSGGLGIGN